MGDRVLTTEFYDLVWLDEISAVGTAVAGAYLQIRKKSLEEAVAVAGPKKP